MSRDKQIEEMANAYYEAMLKARGTLGSMNEGAPKWYARELYNAGYRKASEVAEEIFAEIEKQTGFFRKYMYANESVRVILDVLDTLKKKYTEDKQ